MVEKLLELKNICKYFPGVKALEDVNFEVQKGEVHALVGENGAGKSTLMRILAGVYRPTSGRIIYQGQEVDFNSVLDAQNSGINIIHQEFNLFDNLTVAENIFINKEPTRNKMFVDKKNLIGSTNKLLERFGLELQAETRVKKLSVAYQQMVEIAKALAFDSTVLIMDEPTAALTEKEEKTLFKIIKKLKDDGITIIYISHKLEEIFKICDRVTVLRDGRKIATRNIGDIDKKGLVSDMVGRKLQEFYSYEVHDIGPEVFRVQGLSRKGVLEDVNFSLKKGEILGVAGLVGSGRTEVMRTLLGIDKKSGGEVYLEGRSVSFASMDDAIKEGIAFLPEDRKKQGLIMCLNTRENITLTILNNICSYCFTKKKREREICESFIDALDIKTVYNQKVRNLSGGNQQKVAISKWLAINPRILILDEPTRGIDIGAKAKIYSLISELTRKNISIIMISSELPELLSMCDRIVVMFEGRLTGEFSREYFDQEEIMLAASGEEICRV